LLCRSERSQTMIEERMGFASLARSLAVLIAVATLFGYAIAQTPAKTNYDESKVGSYTLPDPLTFQNGTKVRSAKDWQRRRTEILGLFEENVFGRSAKAPASINYKVFETDKNALGGKATRKQVTIYFSPKS